MKWVSLGLIILISCFVAGLIAFFWASPNKHTFVSGSIETANVNNQVEIHVTQNGFTHINAESDDFYFALGLTHARDFLWEMHVLKNAANGNLSTNFGDIFNPVDQYTTLLNESIGLKIQNEELLKAISKYVDGINFFIESSQRKYPIEFTLLNTMPQYWTVNDVVKTTALMLWLMDSSWQKNFMIALKKGKIPPELRKYLIGESFEEITANDFDSILWILGNEDDLRKLLNFPSTLPITKRHNFDFESSLVELISFQSGFNLSPLFKPIISNNSGKNTLLQTIPGFPLPIGILNESMVSFIKVDLKPDLIDRSVENTQDYSLVGFDGSILQYSSFVETGIFQLPNHPDFSMKFNHLDEDLLLDFLVNDTLVSSNFEFPESSDTYSQMLIDKLDFHSTLPDSSLHAINDYLIQITTGSQVDEIQIIGEYLGNWDFVYGSNSVAPGFLEELLIQTTLTALSNYLTDEEINSIKNLPYFDSFVGQNLIASYLETIENPFLFSPIDQSFIERRINDTIEYLTSSAGENTIEWRWSERFSTQKNDFSLCNNMSDDIFILNTICNARTGSFDYVVSGNNKGFITVTAIPFHDNGIHSITSQIIGVFRSVDGHSFLFTIDEDKNPSSFLVEKKLRGSTIPFILKPVQISISQVETTLTISPNL